MKITLIILTLMCSISIVKAQSIKQKHVPSVIVNAFHLKFPKATDVEWELKKGEYHVEFEVGEVEHEVTLDHLGNMIRHKQELQTTEIPEPIKATLAKSFQNYKIDEPERIEEGETITYKMKLKNSKEKRKVVMDSQGRVIENNKD